MEGLAPPLKCLIEIQASMQNGESMRSGLTRYLHGAHGGDDFASDLRRFIFAWEQAQDWRSVIVRARTPQRRALLELIALGLAGQPVLAHMEELKAELIEACDSEIKRHLEMLPVLMLAPLLLFQFPAFLILLFGPLLSRLLLELSR